MTLGEQKYDYWCTRIRESVNARLVLLCVLDGDEGSGFSIQGPRQAQLVLPELLEEMAQSIRDRHREG